MPATDSLTIPQAAAILGDLSERAGRLEASYLEITLTVQRVADSFDRTDLARVARACGCRRGLTGRRAIEARLLCRITERRGRAERGEVIARVARS